MTDTPVVLALDQGTTSTRAFLFDANANVMAQASAELRQIYPQPGWVEHDPEEIWKDSLAVCREAAAVVEARQIVALGITNQRESTVLWDRRTGDPVSNAIVWQDRRTAQICKALQREGLGDHIRARTGLVVDPYFSATKIAWLLDSQPELREAARSGNILFGTIDSWLIWRLTAGRVHATDVTNVSRTMLFDIDSAAWDATLLARFGIPKAMLPDVRDCRAEFGATDPSLFGAAIPIRGVAGDQQAAAFGQCCFAPGDMKATFGTGCFVLANCGDRSLRSRHGMLTTVLDQRGSQRAYAIEGAIFMAGATVQWLRDVLQLIGTAAESEALASQADANSGVTLVPAFQGLGAPHWDSGARAAISGLSRSSTRADVVRAGLESVAFQARDLIGAMNADLAQAGIDPPASLRADGGMTANHWLMQFLADMLRMPIEVSAQSEATALGAGLLAGQAAGVYPDEAELARKWRAAHRFEPRMPEKESDERYTVWLDAVARIRSSHQP